ncbi:MAG: Response regulator GacA [Acidimicrobiales bacterium]|nr:MAG: DNA-binding response regulator [Actinomycetota bacterium]MBV6510414.1 Response regulator GacA [Acidimicrobiales bacterium]RIK02541.1 MAG: DNA-binding response regulator [Acidobacteriota bacterium]
MRILLADDHVIVRSGLRQIVTDAFPGAVVGEVGSCGELRDKIREADWSVLVLDIALDDRNSLDLVPELLAIRPHMPIVVLSMYGERQFVVRALSVGVLAYLTKDRAPEELLQAIRSVLRGKRYLSETVAAELADHVALVGGGSEEPHDLLSSREFEVFLLLAAARSVSEIAAQLGLSVKTISTYRSRILEKMGMSSNAQLMRYAMQHGLVQ